jgi:tRNA threonylcarbamoyladenosine biosynthesis protein TsaB
MVRLAIDSTSDRLSVAADRDGGIPVSEHLQGARRHAGALLPMIDAVLARLDARIGDVSTIAVADGPGSFTGIRVSFAAAKALAVEGVALVVAPSLKVRAAARGLEARGAEARQVQLLVHRSRSILAVSSALRGELYAGCWRFDANGIETLLEPRTITIADIASLPAHDHAVGDGPEDFFCALGAERAWPDAAVLLRLIEAPGGARTIASPADYEPHYGRPAEAAAKWEREHGRPLPDSPGHAG